MQRKAQFHLGNFGIRIEGKNLLKNLILKLNLVILKDGVLNKKEPTINIGNPKSLEIV